MAFSPNDSADVIGGFLQLDRPTRLSTKPGAPISQFQCRAVMTDGAVPLGARLSRHDRKVRGEPVQPADQAIHGAGVSLDLDRSGGDPRLQRRSSE